MKAIEKLSSTAKEEQDIKWNFTKFLANKDGKVIARFAPTVKPEEIDSKIAELL